MRANYIHYGSPQFRILSDKQIEELHFATLQILERTGVAFDCEEAICLLGDAGAQIVGGCCGSSLEHVKAISAAAKGLK